MECFVIWFGFANFLHNDHNNTNVHQRMFIKDFSMKSLITRNTKSKALLVALTLTLTLLVHSAQTEEALPISIAREGSTLQVHLPSSTKTLVLEVREFIEQSPEWNAVLRLRSPQSARTYYDPVCRVKPSRFYRLTETNGGLPWADNFKLLDLGGTAHELFYHSNVSAIVLIALGNSLQNIQNILPEINTLRDAFGDSVKFWAICCRPNSDRERLKAEADSLGIAFPILMDSSEMVTRNLRPQSFPQAFAIRSLDWTLFYQGAISTRVHTDSELLENHYLRDALSQHFAKETIDVELAEGVGEAADLADLGDISYSKNIVPILEKHCLRCHSEGNIGPFALDSYEAVLQNVFPIKDRVMSGEMPPWHADDLYGKFENASNLSDEEKALLIEWINQGADRGEGEDGLAVASIPSPKEWILGEPDYIVEIPKQEIPAEGIVDYRYIAVTNPVPNDVWLKAAAILPGDAKVLHHSLVFMITDPKDLFAVQGGLAGFYAGYVPGLDPAFFPEGTGKFLPKDSAFVFQQHYTPNGKASSDVTKLGLYLADEEPSMNLLTSAAFTTDIDIPEGQSDYRRSATAEIGQDSWLFEMSPHMHYRGKSFRFEAQYPDGTSEILLSAPDYHFDWQRMYRLIEPKFLPAGTRIVCEGSFDNSPQNRWNPNPNQRVAFGEQSWDEMFIGYFNLAPAR